MSAAKKCEVCGGDLYRWRPVGSSGRRPERFCSPPCRLLWRGKRANRRKAAS